MNKPITNPGQLASLAGSPEPVTICGRVYKIRRMSGFAFLLLQLPRPDSSGSGLLQCTWLPELAGDLSELPAEQSCIALTGQVVSEPRSHSGYEVRAVSVRVLSTPIEDLPVVINNKALDMNLETLLDYRPITLRNEKERALFRIQEGICQAVRAFLSAEDFTEIHSPKLVSEGAEGGSNIFRLDYFGKEAYLAQSPQFYKQTMVGVYGRVYEIAPVYRAEHHDTSRHLNEYIGIDLEMGYIEQFQEIMELETQMLTAVFRHLNEHQAGELALWKAVLPVIPEDGIPCMTFAKVKETVRRLRSANPIQAENIPNSHPAPESEPTLDPNSNSSLDLEPEEERLICQWIKQQTGSDFVFVTHYPSAKRPFYAMDDPENPEVTLSFDLLFRGLEITTGGQRIHSYPEQTAKMRQRGMNPEDFASYLMIHRYGMPPHGGLGIGLERLTACLLGLSNVRQTSLFPRDIHRISP